MERYQAGGEIRKLKPRIVKSGPTKPAPPGSGNPFRPLQQKPKIAPAAGGVAATRPKKQVKSPLS